MTSPGQMAELLHQWIGLDLLRREYRENPDNPKVSQVRTAMEAALSEWSDEQAADFIIKLLLEPPASTEVQSKSPAELRQMLDKLYHILFDV